MAMKLIMLSSAEENYLKAIFKISERKGTPVSTNSIAQELSTSAASVTDMLKKLASKEMVRYEKYRGVHLSNQGIKQATQLIRKHRLWETFLVQKLGFRWGEVHDIAEQLEHIKSDDLVDRMDEFLSFPRFDPHGDPIPDKQGKFVFRLQHSLDALQAGEQGIIVSVQNHERAFLDYLAEFSMHIGARIKVIEQLSFNDSLKIEVDDREPVVISPSITKNVHVKKI